MKGDAEDAVINVNEAVPKGSDNSPYSVTLENLNAINAEKDNDGLQKLGGIKGLSASLYTDLQHGLDPDAPGPAGVEAHRTAFGPNKFPEKPPPNFFAILLDAAQ
eukprot:CAMPEP_0202912236 /NCGR_PEP_ID=MMETSP1392-20130828/57170_1 /ASSEMBLY_ACC=CAM_ASM_000868 /TAXON_ID=225041 /ORGANISM="Chlamydomonas chlamydogama, Strain SAG 11-48b" /LENGTH=104 /DNA_ID=CAMNT_0049603067 /DNA_START=128 /DNA_END=439 /DNA_ORIENTATION=+